MKNTLKPLPSFEAKEKPSYVEELRCAFLEGYNQARKEMQQTDSVAKPEEQCAFCDKTDVFQKGLCPVCFEDHYGN